MAANTAYSQQSLARDSRFLLRVQGALARVAWTVLEEPTTTTGHDQRASYARGVINNVQFSAQTVAPWLVERPNLILFETSYSFEAGAVVSAAGDADIESQLTADWDELSGVAPPVA